MKGEMVRARLDIPAQLHHRLKSVVEALRSREETRDASMRALVTHILSKWVESHARIEVNERELETLARELRGVQR